MCRNDAEITDAVRALLPLARTVAAQMERKLKMPYGELTTQSMIAAWEAAREYSGKIHPDFYQFAYYTIKHRLVDQIRSEFGRTSGGNSRVHDKVHTPIDPHDVVFKVVGQEERAYERIEREMQVASILVRLPERQREVLTKFFFDGLTLTEIGRQMGVTESRACQLKSKALSDARRIVKEQDLVGA